MTSFFKRLFNSGSHPAAENGPAQLTLAAFGKHPGWNDHIPGIGVETEALAHVKHAMYVSGIGGRIDSGAWKSLEADKRLEGFQHTFLWLRDGHVILGRLHSSEDGLHRKEYPLVFCVDCEGIAPENILGKSMPELDRLRNACQATSSAEQVAVECRMAQDRLRDLFLRAATSGPPAITLSLDARRRFMEYPGLGPERVGFLRILHELGSAGNRADSSRMDTRPRHLRLPLAADSRHHALLLWAGFLQGAVPAATPALFISRDGTDWIDAIVGEPTSDDFFCLQAALLALPLASQIPYDLTPELKPRLQQLEARFLGVEPSALPQPQPPLPPNVLPPPVTGRPTPPARKHFNWLIVLAGIVIVLAAVAGVWLVSGNRGSPPESRTLAGKGLVTPAALPPSEAPAKTIENAAEMARLKAQAAEKTSAEIETRRLAEAKKNAEDKAREDARLKAQLTESKISAPKSGVSQGDRKALAGAGDEDAGLAQIALAQGNYARALEISQKWSGDDRFKSIFTQIAAETNQLYQLTQYLQAGNYAPILARTNPLPGNAKFQEVIAKADFEAKLLDQAQAEYAKGIYVFLQRQELQDLKSKPPFQKLFQAGTVEAGLLTKLQGLKGDNQPQAARDLIVKNNLAKPPFNEIEKWADVELNRVAGQAQDQQQAETLFQQGDYVRASEMCKKYAGIAAFDAVAKKISEEQGVLTGAKTKLAEGDYSFLGELAGQGFASKPPFAELSRQGTAEQKVLSELEKLKQANDWQAVQSSLSKLMADVSSKSPFATLRQWAQSRAAEDAELKAKSPAWLDAELEVLLVRFNILSPNDRWLQTPEARKEKPMDGLLSMDSKEYYLNRVKILRAEYTKHDWLGQRDRKKYLDRLESNIESR